MRIYCVLYIFLIDQQKPRYDGKSRPPRVLARLSNTLITCILSQFDLFRRCRRVRRLANIPQPSSLQMVDDYKAVVLCQRELRVYDLNKGVLLAILKGTYYN